MDELRVASANLGFAGVDLASGSISRLHRTLNGSTHDAVFFEFDV